MNTNPKIKDLVFSQVFSPQVCWIPTHGFQSHLFKIKQLLCSPPLQNQTVFAGTARVSKPEKAAQKDNESQRVADFFSFRAQASDWRLVWEKGMLILKTRILCLIFGNMKELNVYLGRDLKPFVGFLSFADKGNPLPLFLGKAVLQVVLTGANSRSPMCKHYSL